MECLITTIPQLLKQSKVIAILGFHNNPTRAAHYVPRYLHEQGYMLILVNPLLEGQIFFGQKVRASLDEIEEVVDIITIFRAPLHLMGHLSEIRAMKITPKTVWLQTGIYHSEFADELKNDGVIVIENRCIMMDHRFFCNCE